MKQNQPSWEGSILAFTVISSALLGVGYVVSINTGLQVPWLALLIVALVAAWALRRRRRRM